MAAFVKLQLREADDLPSGPSAPIRSRMQAPLLKTILEAQRVSWLPIDVQLDLTEAIFAELGERDGRALCRRWLLRVFEQPLLKPFVSGAMRIGGGSLEQLGGWVPRSWPLLYRDAGVPRWSLDGPGRARLTLDRAPAPVRDNHAFRQGMAGGFEALFDLTACAGTIGVADEKDSVVFHLSWAESR